MNKGLLERVSRMYNVGEILMYGTNGVCEITEITTKLIAGTKMEYYVLKPKRSDSSTLFVPTANEKLVSKMRYVISAKEINYTLDNISESNEWIENKNERIEYCRNIISEGDFKSLVELVRTLRIHEKEQAQKGRHLHMSDERYLKEAERMICDEISYVLQADKKDVLQMIYK